MSDGLWRISVDAGGTFTDCVGVDPSGREIVCKVLSSGVVRVRGVIEREGVRVAHTQRALCGMLARVDGDANPRRIVGIRDDLLVLDGWEHAHDGRRCVVEIGSGEVAPLLGARLLTDTPAGEALPAMWLRLATTRATNALLERRFGRVGLFVSEGFGDLLRIGDQRRGNLFRLAITRPVPISEFVYEVSGRLNAGGQEVASPDRQQWGEAIVRAIDDGCEVLAICLMHAWASDTHERAFEAMVRERCSLPVLRSSDVAARMGYWARAQTTCVEAALEPVLGAYLSEIERCVGNGRVRVLTSGGGLRPVRSFRSVDALVSGPAGGVLGALKEARRLGFDRIISFDMGGTSTDVARCEGDVPRSPTHEVGGVRMLREAVAIETVAAGGGSICEAVDGRVRVGPRSAGADPGPACYGRGGPLTLTDVNLLLGRIDPAHFEVPVDVEAARRRLGDLREDLLRQGGEVSGEDELLAGLVVIADERMSDAIRRISVRQGYDPSVYVLVAFGGAGAQHACGVSERLGISRVLVPARASVLSAEGLRVARAERVQERQVLQRLDRLGQRGLDGMLDAMRTACEDELRQDGVAGTIQFAIELHLRRLGQESTIAVPLCPGDGMERIEERFCEREAAMFGATGMQPIEIESLIVRGRPYEMGQDGGPIMAGERVARPADSARVFDGRVWREVGAFSRTDLAAGDVIDGPALVCEASTSIWIASGWRCVVQHSGALLLDRTQRSDGRVVLRGTLGREVVVRRLDAICEHMGEAIRRMSVSVNVKERMDYSCGVLDPQGRLVASAPHIPVHLGALGACVRRVIEALGPLGEGDVAITNHPAFGGSHLPDLTVIQGVHDDGGRLIAYIASRAHHAEIGGISPGSMPAAARCLEEEGVVIAPMLLVRGQMADWDAFGRLLRDGPYPSRCPWDNLADTRAQVAAGRLAGEQMRALHREIGGERLSEAMDWIRAHTRGLVRDAIGGLDAPEGASFEVHLDQGDAIRVRLSIDGGLLVVDLRETDDQRPDGLNAPLCVTRSAVAYVVRLILDREVALNDGLLDQVVVRTRRGSLLDPVFCADPARCPAVSAGNVEISQLLVEAMVGALGLSASSQGTMNNLILGNDSFGLYETIGGGSGAGEGFHGCDAVHTHMTNTAIGDAEVVEQRTPLRIERFSIRRGSGGAGAFRGGDGIVRTIRALSPMELTVVTQRRVQSPFGMHGGAAGKRGAQCVIRTDGRRETLASSDHAMLQAGDRVEILTPGGGGWGRPPQTP